MKLENIITTLNIIGSRNNHDKIDSLKKINIQKCISWCEKYDISCIKLLSSNNIFLSGVYDDNTITAGGSNSSNNNSFKRNTFLKNKNYNNKSSMSSGANANKKHDNTNTINATSNETIHNQPLQEQEQEQDETNLVSVIVDDIIEHVSIMDEKLVAHGVD